MVCKGLVHPNIVELHGVCFDDERPWLVMEYMEGGSLDAYFSARRKKKPGHLRHKPPKPYQARESCCQRRCRLTVCVLHFLGDGLGCGGADWRPSRRTSLGWCLDTMTVKSHTLQPNTGGGDVGGVQQLSLLCET